MSRSHYVAIGQGRVDVKEFGMYDKDLAVGVQHFLDNKITDVFIGSTGIFVLI